MRQAILGALCAISVSVSVASQGTWHKFLRNPVGVPVERLATDAKLNPFGATIDVAPLKAIVALRKPALLDAWKILDRKKRDYAKALVRAGKVEPTTERVNVGRGVAVGWGGRSYVVRDFPAWPEATQLAVLEKQLIVEVTAAILDATGHLTPNALWRDVISGGAAEGGGPPYCLIQGCLPSWYVDPESTCSEYTVTENHFLSTWGECECDPGCKVAESGPACVVDLDVELEVPAGKFACEKGVKVATGETTHEDNIIEAQECNAADKIVTYVIYDNADCSGLVCALHVVVGCQNCNLPCTLPL